MSILDDMEHEAKYTSATEPLDKLLDEVITTMRHASIFIRTREKMHPTGVQLWDELLEKLAARQHGR